MAEGDDGVRARRLEGVDLLFGRLDLAAEVEVADQHGVGGGAGIRRRQREDADLQPAALEDDAAAVAPLLHTREQRLVAVIHVCGEHGEVCAAHVLKQVFGAEVELVVAQRHRVVAGEVEQFDDVRALRQRGDGQALRRVARVDEQRALRLLFERGDAGDADDTVFLALLQIAVRIVGVVDDRLPLGGLLFLRLRRAAGKAEHRHGQRQRRRR